MFFFENGQLIPRGVEITVCNVIPVVIKKNMTFFLAHGGTHWAYKWMIQHNFSIIFWVHQVFNAGCTIGPVTIPHIVLLRKKIAYMSKI